MPDDLDSLMYGLSGALAIPLDRLRGRAEFTDPTNDMQVYYDNIMRQQWREFGERAERFARKVRFITFVRPAMQKRKGRRPKFARCWN